MILIEEMTHDPVVTHARLAVLECLATSHKIHCYTDPEALAWFLDQGLAKMAAKGYGRLRRAVLVYSDPRAREVVATRMEPGFEFAAWPQPDAWLALYQRIDHLRDVARAYQPNFIPRHLSLAAQGR